jgi:hypothetical protein
MTMPQTAWAFDPPRIIGGLSGQPPERFGEQFCWAGDQNGDGFDDLLLTHDPSRQEGHPNVVKLFFGGERIDNNPDLVFEAQEETEVFGYSIAYLGQLSQTNENWFLSIGQRRLSNISRIYFYKGGRELDSSPDLMMTSTMLPRFEPIPPCYKQRPSDFNADGFDDFLACYGGDSREPGELHIFFGGEEFDTLSDWRTVLSIDMSYTMSSNAASGCDVNNDGFDDFFFLNYDENFHYIDLYLGGDPMDTVAAYSWSMNDFNETISPRKVDDTKFAVLSDVNGDGYDDWAIQWTWGRQGWDESGFYVFFGGENPNFEPDLDLDDNHSSSTEGQIGGVDMNADGLGDIVTTHIGALDGDGEMQIYFGNRNFPHRASININMTEIYGRRIAQRIGAIGDYDGDQVIDFVGTVFQLLNIISHGQDWSNVSSEGKPIPLTPFILDLFPNPFNQTLTVTIGSSLPDNYSVSILNIDGRSMSEQPIVTTASSASKIDLSTQNLPAGVYLVRCVNKSTGVRQFQKAVLLR